MSTPTTCDHDKRFTGVFDLPKGTNGCLACAYEKSISDLAAAQSQSIRDSMTIEHSRVDAYNLRLELAAAQEALRFVERWANHHGVKPCVKPEHALSTIQHYPPILAITESYADGKVPETRNPWADLAAAQEALSAKDAELASVKAERDAYIHEVVTLLGEAYRAAHPKDAP